MASHASKLRSSFFLFLWLFLAIFLVTVFRLTQLKLKLSQHSLSLPSQENFGIDILTSNSSKYLNLTLGSTRQKSLIRSEQPVNVKSLSTRYHIKTKIKPKPIKVGPAAKREVAKSPPSGPLVFNKRRVKYPHLYRQTLQKEIVFHTLFTPNPLSNCNTAVKTPKCSTEFNSNIKVTGLTLVTAYFDIGTFNKHNRDLIHSSDLYRDWMRKYALILNPLIFYADKKKHLDYFRTVRKGLPTKYVLLERRHLWAFSLLNETTKILRQKGYPVYYPYSTRPDYICAVHAKYEVLQNATAWNPFGTSHFAWSDIGLYREVTSLVPYRIVLPDRFDHIKVNIGEVIGFPWSARADRKTIFYKKLEWLAGGLFIAERTIMAIHAVGYIANVKSCMKDKLAGADQQILYDLINNRKHLVDIQVYSVSAVNQWFAFMFYCRKEEE